MRLVGWLLGLNDCGWLNGGALFFMALIQMMAGERTRRGATEWLWVASELQRILSKMNVKEKVKRIFFYLFSFTILAFSILFSIYIWEILFVKIFYFRKCDKSSKIEFSVNCIYWEHDGMA